LPGKNEKEVNFIAFIKIGENEELERAIKRFRKKVDKEAIIREWKRHEYFQKPSSIRHQKEKARRRKERKRLQRFSRNRK
jgi:small subunit ribosomal protein S21